MIKIFNIFQNIIKSIYFQVRMQEQNSQQNYPTITEDDPKPFKINVKLLSNEVYEFQISPQMKVSEFKNHITEKVNVPVERMRIVFAGKQLLDDKPINEYVSESGMTVHLIARSAPQPATNNTEQSSQSQQRPEQQQSSQQQQQPPNPFGNIMGMMGNLFNGQGANMSEGQQAPQISMTFGNSENIGTALNGLLGNLGNLGLRIPPNSQPFQPPPPVSRPSNQQQSTSSNQQNQSQSSSNSLISYNQIGRLNRSINQLNLPIDNVSSAQQTLNNEGVARYLRRLYHQNTRALMQLNRVITLLQQGNSNHLREFVPIFQSLNQANTVAVNCIHQLTTRSEQGNSNTQSVQQPQQTQHQQIQQPQQLSQQSEPSVRGEIRIQNIVIPENGEENSGNAQIQSAVFPFNLNSLGNLGNLGMMLNPQQQQQSSTSPPTQQQRQQNRVEQEQNINNQNDQSNQVPQSQQSQQPSMNMGGLNSILGGLDIGSLISSMGGMGNIGNYLTITVRQMLEQGGQQISIAARVLGSLTGNNILTAFTSKDFRFLAQKQPQFRQNLKKQIEQSSQQRVIEQITQSYARFLTPMNEHPSINSFEQCQHKSLQILARYVDKWVQLTLQQSPQQYTDQCLQIMKQCFCKNILLITRYTQGGDAQIAFGIIKKQALEILDRYAPGLAGLFYGFVQKDMIRVYREYLQEEKRKAQRSEEEAASEEKLIAMISQKGSQDSEKLKNIKHSDQYWGSKK